MNDNAKRSSLRILLVEDNKHDMLAICNSLEKSDIPIEVSHCARAEDALGHIHDDILTYDAVISNYKLPDRSGLDLFKEIRDSGSKTPFTLLNSQGSAEIEEEAFKIGVDHYIIKDPNQIYLKLLPIKISEMVQKRTKQNSNQRLEDVLKDSEEKYRTLYESSVDGIIFTDLEGNILDVNRAYLDMLGYSKNEMRKISYQQLTPVKWHKKEREIVKNQIFTQGYSNEYEKEYIRKDGTILPISIRVWLTKDAQDEPIGMWCIVRDITERKLAEEKLQLHQIELEMQNEELRKTRELLERSRDNYSNLYDFAPVGYFTFDKQGSILEANITGADYLGIERKNLINKLFSKFICKTDQDIFYLHRQKVSKTQIKQTCELKIRKKDGTQFHALMESIPIKNDKGNFNKIRTVITDISDRKDAMDRIQEAREYAENIITTVREPLVVLDADLRVISANQSYYQTFKVRSKETKNKFIYDLGNRQWDIQTLRDLMENILRKNTNFENFEVKHKFETIGQRTMLLNARRLEQENGKTKQILLAIEDITERKHAEEELRNAQEQLAKKNKLTVLGQLAGCVGHELRNPLGAIKNAAYFLNMTLEKPEPEVKESLEIIDSEVMTSDRIISTLLDFARVKPPMYRKVDTNDIIKKSLSHSTIPENIKVVSQLDKVLPTLLADPDQLKQIFTNIITNAIQAMPEGGQLTIRPELKGQDQITVSITDTGVGIPRENLAKLFEPLYTSKAKGIGLGLVVVKSLIEGHGGTINVRSDPGKGSTFTILLPINRKDGE